MSSCTRCRRVHCLTTENVFQMNSKTATDHNHDIQCHCLQFFFLSVQIIFSRIFYCFLSLFAKPLPRLKDVYLTVKFDSCVTIMSETGVR